MKIYGFTDEASRDFNRQIDAMKRNGLDGFEIRFVDGDNISDISKEKAKYVRERLDAEGLSTWSLGSPIGKIGIDDDFAAHVEKLKYTLEIGHILGTSNIRIFSFYLPEGSDFDGYFGEVSDKVNKMTEICLGENITPCLENELGLYGNIASRSLKLHEAIPGLRAVYDPANYVLCGQDTLEGWKLLRKYTKYFHIKDADENGFMVPAGKGKGNIPKLIADFISDGGEAATLEPHLSVFDGLKMLQYNGDTAAVGSYGYPDSDTAFDAACSAFFDIVNKAK